jgi:hypothetical protein
MTTASQDLDGECIHLLTRRFCADCNGTADLQRREHDLEVERVLALPGWKLSQYGGRCAKCRTYYTPRSPIRKKNGLDRCPPDSPNWIGMCCAPTEEEACCNDEEDEE